MTFYAGLDLAQSSDYSGLAIIERVNVPPVFRLRHLEKLPQKMSYPDQCALVVKVCARVGHLCGGMLPTLAIDYTSVGTPVYDILKSMYQGSLVGVLITGGSQVIREGHIIRIPKRDLVSRLRVELEAGQLKIARQLPTAEEFVEELQDFELKVNESGHVSYDAVRGHDDMVLAVAIALYIAYDKGHGSGEMFRTPIIRDGVYPTRTNIRLPFGHSKIPRFTEVGNV